MRKAASIFLRACERRKDMDKSDLLAEEPGGDQVPE